MLIPSPRLRPGDVDAWEAAEAGDAAWARTLTFRRRLEEAELAVVRFARQPCYAGVSWGKDSVIVADMVARLVPAAPLVWVRVDPISNPDCPAVRDAFLAAHPGVLYDEIVVQCTVDDAGETHATGTLEAGFATAVARYGRRRLSGIRSDESADRAHRALLGVETASTCAPLIRWSARDVFACLYLHRLPVHPAYAMTMGGALDRARLRVASIGGKRGRGTGRAEWEALYYPERHRV